MSRRNRVNRFHDILRELEDRLGGKRCLDTSHGGMDWPRRAVYFFFEPGEKRSSRSELKVVRVGTHALKPGSKSTLWRRLRTHRGTLSGKRPGGGNHRGSVFRLHVGSAILRKEGLENEYPTWGEGSSASTAVRNHEYPIEKKVSQHIRKMPFLWLKIDDSPRSRSQRAYIERNSIALLSNYGKLGTVEAIDPPSTGWLGHYCNNEMVRKSALWNVNYVTETQVNQKFLSRLEEKVEEISSS